MRDKIFDVYGLVLYIWKKKLLLIAGIMIGIGAGYLYNMMTSVTTYQAVMQIRIPPYCDTRDINTVAIIARSQDLDSSVNIESVAVSANWIRDTAVMQVEFSSLKKDNLVNYVKAYRPLLVEKIEHIIQEKVQWNSYMNAMHGGQADKLTNIKPIEGYAEIVQDGSQVKEVKPILSRRLLLTGFLGFVAALGLIMLKFVLKWAKE